MNDLALEPVTRQIVVDEVFPHAPDAVWRTLTTPELMGRWLMEPTGFQPVVGNRFTYQTTPKGEWDGVIHCHVVDVSPGRRLVYEWQGGDESNDGYGSRLDTVVSFTLTEVDGGTRLQLIHSGFRIPANASAYEKMSAGWVTVVSTVGSITGELDS